MNQPEDKSKELAIAVLSTIDSNPFIRAMHQVGLLPVNCRRFVIDSGPPDGVMKIYFDAFVDDRICSEPIISSLGEIRAIVDKP